MPIRSTCTHCAAGGRVRDRAVVDTASWILTASLAALIPKCPVCLAAYVACGTGIGLSISIAGYLRTGMIAVSVVALTGLTWRLMRRLADFGLAKVRAPNA